MSEPPSKHTAYLDNAKNMNFGELRTFIDDALERSSNAGPHAELPGSTQAFLDLW